MTDVSPEGALPPGARSPTVAESSAGTSCILTYYSVIEYANNTQLTHHQALTKLTASSSILQTPITPSGGVLSPRWAP